MFVSFFKTEFKNSIQMIKKTAIAYFLVILSLTAVFAAVSFLIEKDSVVKRIRTAIVIQQDDKMTAMLVRYISQMDSVKGVSEFVRTDRDTAFEMLKEDKVNVVVDLPEDFYDDVNNGLNTPLNIYVKHDADKVTLAFVQILKSGTGYVKTVESTVYSFLDEYRLGEYEINDGYSSLGDHIAMCYATLILHRSRIFNTIIMSKYGNVGIYGYYICTLILLIIIYSAFSFSFMYKSEHRSIERKMRVYGMTSLRSAFARELVMTVHLSAIGIIIYLISYLISDHIEIDIYSIRLEHILFIIICSFTISGLFEMIYSIAGSDYAAFGGLFSGIIFLIMCSGMIIPLGKMPPWIRVISNINPLKYVFAALLKCINGSEYLVALIPLLIIIIIQQSIGILCRKY